METKFWLVMGFFAALLVLGRMQPFAPIATGLWRIVRNVSLGALNGFQSAFIVVPLSLLASQWALDWRPEFWSGWTAMAVDIIVLDLWIYWWHRANHEFPLLWRFHEVHHLDETLDASSALRFHFGEVLLSSVVRAIVIFCLGVPIATVLVFETLVALVAIFHHSNIRLPQRLEKLLSLVVVTPSIHWVHHHARRADTDSNYATFLSLWDDVFKSRSVTKRTAEMAIGVEGLRDRNLLQLILRPFISRRN